MYLMILYIGLHKIFFHLTQRIYLNYVLFTNTSSKVFLRKNSFVR